MRVALVARCCSASFTQRYRPAFALYDRLCDPEASADVVVNSEVFALPRLLIRPTGRLGMLVGKPFPMRG